MQPQQTIKLLVVEDSMLVQADLLDRLNKAGYLDIHAVTTGEEALAYTQNHQTDIIIMDIELDGQLDGIDTVKQLQQRSNAPIIYLTDHTDEATFQRALKTRPAAFLHKPFVDRQVAHQIEIAWAACKEHQQQQAAKAEEPLLVTDGIFLYKENRRFQKVPLQQIRYLKSSGAYCNIYMEGAAQPQIVSHNMGLLFTILKKSSLASSFVQVSRFHVINTRHITGFENKLLYLGEDAIKTSKQYIDDPRSVLLST